AKNGWTWPSRPWYRRPGSGEGVAVCVEIEIRPVATGARPVLRRQSRVRVLPVDVPDSLGVARLDAHRLRGHDDQLHRPALRDRLVGDAREMHRLVRERV